jgi:uncharacterized protein (TIGR02757 family)
MNIKQLLDNEVSLRNSALELSFDKPDPLMIAKKYNDEYISLFCALFAYGKATKIVEFLYSIDFALFNESEEKIRESLRGFYYRFQNSEDIINFKIVNKGLYFQNFLLLSNVKRFEISKTNNNHYINILVDNISQHWLI